MTLLLLCPGPVLAAAATPSRQSAALPQAAVPATAAAPGPGGVLSTKVPPPGESADSPEAPGEEAEVDPRLLPPLPELAALDAATRRDLPAAVAAPVELDPRKLFPITAGMRVGTEFPQVLSSLGVAPVVTLEVGYLLPMLGQRLQLFLDGSYTKGKKSVSASDSRLPGNTIRNYGTREREIVLSMGGRYRVFDPMTRFNFYGRLGLSLSVHKSRDKEDRQRAIGVYRENVAIPGMIVAAGFEYMLGPGAISAEVSYATEIHDLRFRGGLEEGGIGFTVGYHFMF